MITNRTLFTIIFAAYFILDFFFSDAILYITGGVILGSIQELAEKKITTLSSILIWVGLLLAFLILFYRSCNKALKIFILLFIVALLYVIDFIRMELLPIDVHTVASRYFVIAISVVSKSCLLYLIIYYDRNQRILIAKPQ